VSRRRWRLILDVLSWLGICGLLLIDSSSDPRPWELIGGLVATTVAVAATRRLPMLSLAAGTSSGLVVLFDLGDQVSAWERAHRPELRPLRRDRVGHAAPPEYSTELAVSSR
jgi:hypothetical protein